MASAHPRPVGISLNLPGNPIVQQVEISKIEADTRNTPGLRWRVTRAGGVIAVGRSCVVALELAPVKREDAQLRPIRGSDGVGYLRHRRLTLTSRHYCPMR